MERVEGSYLLCGPRINFMVIMGSDRCLRNIIELKDVFFNKERVGRTFSDTHRHSPRTYPLVTVSAPPSRPDP